MFASDLFVSSPSESIVLEGTQGDAYLARKLQDAIRSGEITLAEQVVSLAGAPETVLYRECLLRHTDGAPIGEWIAASERVGYIRAVDRFVVERVIQRLRSRPDERLGANISGKSAAADFWWDTIFMELRSDPSLASRLTIEVTETAPLAGGFLKFVAELRQLGVHIAMDDFAGDDVAIETLHALKPKLVKIDASLLWAARSSAHGKKALLAAVTLCRTVADLIIIEGVETESDSRNAFEVGVAWLQGYLVGRPELLK